MAEVILPADKREQEAETAPDNALSDASEANHDRTKILLFREECLHLFLEATPSPGDYSAEMPWLILRTEHTGS